MNWNNASDSFIKISLRMCTRARLRSHTLTKLWVMMWTVSAISVLRINRIGTEKNQKSNGRKKERKKWRWTMINSIQSLAPIASNTSEFTWITCDGVCFNLFIRCFFLLVRSRKSRPALFERYINTTTTKSCPRRLRMAIYWNINFGWMKTNVKTIYEYLLFTLDKMYAFEFNASALRSPIHWWAVNVC